MTEPNSYQSLVSSAARLVDMDLVEQVEEGDLSLAATFIERNREAIASARHALAQPCSVPLEYVKDYIAEHCDDWTPLRNLARAFRMEAIAAACRDDYRAVARIGVEMLELANAARRGGLIVDLQIAGMFAVIALNTIRKYRSNFTEAERRRLINELQRLEAAREPFDDVVARDRAWEIAVEYEDPPDDFMSMDLGLGEDSELTEEQQQAMRALLQHYADLPEPQRRQLQWDQDNCNLAMMRMLAVDLALHSYRETTRAFPASLSSLVPDFFARVPLDPFTNNPLLYRRVDRLRRWLAGDSFLLYSTGPKRVDDGGKFGPWCSVQYGGANLCLDVLDYENATC